jgi:hypothetical protein
MLVAIPNTFFHYTPSPTKYLHGLRTHRHHVTTYVKKTSPKIAARGILSKRWGSSASLRTMLVATTLVAVGLGAAISWLK